MYQNCCKKCGGVDLYIEEKATNTGLYCGDCGAWLKWVSKDEIRAFQHSNRNKDTGEELEEDNDIELLVENIINRKLLELAQMLNDKFGELI